MSFLTTQMGFYPKDTLCRIIGNVSHLSTT
jgi:hypothetical protein